MNQESRIKNRSVAKAMERRRQELRIKHKKLYSLFVTIQKLSKKLSFRMISEESSNLINNPNLEDCHVGRRLPPRNDRLLLNPELLPSFLPLNSRAFTFLRSKKANPLLQFSNSGFTLVEILVVMAILSVFGTLVVTIFSRSLTGSNKSQIIGAIKQNGQATLETMDKTIRNADNVVCPSPDNKTLVVVKNGIYTRYRFIDATNSSNGFIQKDNPIKNSNETDPQLVNRLCALDAIMPQPVILTDTNPQTGISIVSGLFTLNSSAGFMDQVTIKFDLWPGINAPKAVAGQIDPITFQTTIQLR